jgi:hypothetical protein
MKIDEFVKTAGRKFSFSYAALGGLVALSGAGRLSGAEFVGAFGALVTTVMAANYGENREKQRAASAEQPKAAA